MALDNYTADGLNNGEYSSTWLIVQVWLSDLPAAACVCMCAYNCAVHPLSYRYRRGTTERGLYYSGMVTLPHCNLHYHSTPQGQF